MPFILEIGKTNDFGRSFGPIHIIYMKLLEIAKNYPSWVLADRKFRDITPCLSKWSERVSITLRNTGMKVLTYALLLNQDFCRRNAGINETCPINMGTFLKLYQFLGPVYSKNITQQREPKHLAFTLF